VTTIKFSDRSPELIIPVGRDRPGPDTDQVQVFVLPLAQTRVIDFLKTSELEQGGLLLGRIWSQASSPGVLSDVEIFEAVPSENSTSSAYHLQMTAKVWSSAQTALSRLNHELNPSEQALRIVGWFHSHPHLGAFFSETDIATQRAFFNQPYSIGWVIDPYSRALRKHEAFFLGPDCVTVQRIRPPQEAAENSSSPRL
jgi:proteasome lid subunit RPN8/RPN11